MASKILRIVRQHPDVAPVFIITCLGATFATVALVRASVCYTEVSWDRRNNQHPWLKVQHTEQTKFIRSNDYSKLENKRPKI